MSDLQKALAELLAWSHEANSRLAYEQDKETGYQFGGNPHLNPVFKQAQAALAGLVVCTDDDREPIQPGDYGYYRTPGAADPCPACNGTGTAPAQPTTEE